MRIAVAVVSVLTAAAASLAGCKTDPKPASTAQAGSGSGSAGSAGSAVAVAPPAAGSAGSGSNSRGPIALPRGTGAPPKKTTAKLAAADFQRLGALEFPGFKSKVREQTEALDVRHSTPRPTLATTVTITPCFDCPAMTLEAWKAREASLRLLIGPELKDRPDTVWEMGQTELNGVPVIFTFQLGHHFGKDDNGNPMAAFSNAYALYFNDGTNQIRVVTEYKDDPVAREDLALIAPREDLEKVARAFLDAYTQAW